MGDYMIIGYAEPQHREKRKKIKEIFIDSKLPAEKRPEIWPVSYTHLDVYKRQEDSGL